jgi:hypothetical protein
MPFIAQVPSVMPAMGVDPHADLKHKDPFADR